MRQDYRIASIVRAIYNVNRSVKRHPRPFDLKDFLLLFGDSAQRQEEEKQKTAPARIKTALSVISTMFKGK